MDNEYINIDDVISTIIDTNDITVMPAIGELGLKSSVGELISNRIDDHIERMVIQFYVKCTIPRNPSDKTIGFTREDVTVFKGVAVADVGEEIDPPRYIGRVWTHEEFANKFITDEHTKEDIEILFGRLLSRAYPSEEWLDKISTLYNNRVVGKPWIVSEMVVC